MTDRAVLQNHGEEGAEPSKTRRYRRMAVIGTGTFLLLTAAVLMLPKLVSTDVGTRLVLAALNGQIPGTVDIDRLTVSWFGRQRVEGLRLQGLEGNDVLSAKDIAMPDLSLVSTVLGYRQYGHVTVTGVIVDLERFDDGTTNIQRALYSSGSAPQKPASGVGQSNLHSDFTDLHMSVELIDTQITYSAPDQTPIVAILNTAAIELNQTRPITVKMSGQVTREGQTGQWNLDAMIRHFFDPQGLPAWDSAQVEAEVNLGQVPIEAIEALSNQHGLLAALIGSHVDSELQIEGTISDVQAKLMVTSPNISVQAHLVKRDGHVRTLGPIPLQWTITPRAWTMLSAGHPTLSGTALVEKAVIRGVVERLEIPLGEQGRFAIHRTDVEAGVSVDDLLIDAGQRLGKLGFSHSNLRLVSRKGIGNQVAVTGQSFAVHADHRGRIGVDLQFSELFDKVGQLSMSTLDTATVVELSDVPVMLFEKFVPAAKGVAQLVGPVLSAELRAHLKPDSDHTAAGVPITLQANSQHLSANLSVIIRPDLTVTQHKDRVSWIDLRLTPASLDHLLASFGVAPDRMTVAAPTLLRLTVSDAMVVWQDTQKGKDVSPIDLSKSVLAATLIADTKSLHFPKAQHLSGQFEQVRINVNTLHPDERVDLVAEVVIDDSATSKSAGKPILWSTHRIASLFDSDGRLSVPTATITSTTRLDQWPVPLVDKLVHGNGQLIALMGQTATIILETDGPASLPGHIKFSLESDNARVTAQGMIDRWGKLILTDDLKATLMVTDALGKRYLAALNPILADVRSADQPIELTIDHEGFAISLTRLDVADLKMKGQLEIGTLTMQQGDLGRALVMGLRAMGSSIQNQQRFDATFTTLRFTMNDGVIYSDDLWMDTADLLLGTQARVYLTGQQDRWRADVLMGIPGETLHLVPRLAKRISPAALYELPVTGPLHKLEPDVGSLLTRIVADAALGEAGAPIGQLAIDLGKAIFEKPDQNEESIAPDDDTWSDAKWHNRPPMDNRVSEAQAQETSPEPDPEEPKPLDILSEIIRRATEK